LGRKKNSANCLLTISDGHALTFFGCYFCKDIQEMLDEYKGVMKQVYLVDYLVFDA
jgi:hypothetical protein